jgi:hypothetical protein
VQRGFPEDLLPAVPALHALLHIERPLPRLLICIHNRSVKISVRDPLHFGVGGSMPLTNGPDPAICVVDLQDATKKLILFKSFSAYYFLKVHLHHFSKLEGAKEVTKQ